MTSIYSGYCHQACHLKTTTRFRESILALLLLTVLLALPAHAHDPYEITSVAYLHSNRIELFIELEFPTAMKLAGQEPRRDVALLPQFEAAVPHLRDLAGSFFAFTAGNHVVPPLRTNVALANEEHIQLKLEFAPTAHRPLQFTARGLANIPDSPYGTTLTVLDMVNQKVLGQATLFANSALAEFPPRPESPPPALAPPEGTTNIVARLSPAEPDPNLNSAPSTAPAIPAPAARLSVFFLIGIAVLAFVILSALRHRN